MTDAARIRAGRELIARALPDEPWLAPIFERLDAAVQEIEAEANDPVAIARAFLAEQRSSAA